MARGWPGEHFCQNQLFVEINRGFWKKFIASLQVTHPAAYNQDAVFPLVKTLQFYRDFLEKTWRESDSSLRGSSRKKHGFQVHTMDFFKFRSRNSRDLKFRRRNTAETAPSPIIRFVISLRLTLLQPTVASSEPTNVQAVVGSIVWAFCRLKKPRRREMGARCYAL